MVRAATATIRNTPELLRPFQERGKEEALYLLRNTHWNGAGCQLAGELLFANLSPWLDELLKKSP